MLDKIDMIEIALTYDENGRILRGNKQAHRELGYQEDLQNLFVSDIFISETDFDAAIHDLTMPQEITGLVAYRKNRTCFPVYVRVHPKENEEDENYILALNMLTQSNLEKEVLSLKIKADEFLKRRNDFLATMTHELRVPVNGINGHISAMLSSSANASDRKTYSIIQKCCEDMSFIINNILDFSKLEAGEFELEHNVFDLYELLNHIVATNLAVVNEKGIRIILNIADNVPREIYGDGIRLGQILNNLISNAVKFTDIGHVGIDVNKHGQFNNDIELFFMIRDTGIGIAPDQMDKLFKSFSQIDSSSTRKHGGTGLGLVITKELVKLMGGSIRVESTPNKGSNFSFDVHLKTAEHIIEKEPPAEEELFIDNPDRINVVDSFLYDSILQSLTLENTQEVDSVYQFGTPDNIAEVNKKCELLILALELEAWYKAELMCDNLKKLLKDGPDDIKKMVFRLGMAIRKEENGKSLTYFASFMEMLEEEYVQYK